MYEGFVVYGPYVSKEDGRSRVFLRNPLTKETLTVSYPKYMMELYLGRYLSRNEDVHHKDENVSNNVIENFEIIDHVVHVKYHSPILIEYFECLMCENHFELSGKRLADRKRNLQLGKVGPFCSKSCAGRHSQQC